MASDDVVYRLRLLLLGLSVGACADVGDTISDAAAPPVDVAVDDAGIDVPALPDAGAADDADVEVADVAPIDVAPDVPDLPDVTDLDDVEDLPDVEDAPEPSDEGAEVAEGDAPDVEEDADTFDPAKYCNDKNPCTYDWHDGEICHHDYLFGYCCAANPMCDDSDACTLDVCVDGYCTHEPSCCQTDDECFDGESLCTEDSCHEGTCVHAATLVPGCCKPEIFSETFDGGSIGALKVKNADAAVGWHLETDETLAKSPPGVLWYGDPQVKSYDSGLKNDGTITLPILSLPGGVETTLSFDLFMDIEAQPSYDLLSVTLEDGLPGDPTIVWDKSKALSYGAWFTVSIDLSAWGGYDVVLAIAFDTVDEIENGGQGLFIDNLAVTSTCAPLTCTADLECDDALGATNDLCAGGTCAHTPNSAYCTDPGDCDDGKPCTSNVCLGGQCTYYDISGCCLQNAQCDDQQPCTIDDCIGASAGYGGYCNHVSLPDCCVSELEGCNDGNPCTVDACPVVGLGCAHTPIAGCCNANEDCDDLDPCSSDLCSAGACVHATLCCSTDADCSDGGSACTTEACVDGACQSTFIDGEACCKSGVLSVTFEGPSWGGFETTADSAPFDGLGWTVVSEPSTSPFGALHYGVPGGTYDNGAQNNGAVDGTAFMVPALSVTVLSFQAYLDTEWSNGAGNIEWDRLKVFAVRVDQPSDATLLWDSADGDPLWWAGGPDAPTGPVWTPVKGLDLTPLAGRLVRLRFAFDTLDEEANGYGGVTIDDVQVLTTCGP